MGSTWAVLNAIWRRKDTKPLFQMFQIYFDILNNGILLVNITNKLNKKNCSYSYGTDTGLRPIYVIFFEFLQMKNNDDMRL